MDAPAAVEVRLPLMRTGSSRKILQLDARDRRAYSCDRLFNIFVGMVEARPFHARSSPGQLERGRHATRVVGTPGAANRYEWSSTVEQSGRRGDVKATRG